MFTRITTNHRSATFVTRSTGTCHQNHQFAVLLRLVTSFHKGDKVKIRRFFFQSLAFTHSTSTCRPCKLSLFSEECPSGHSLVIQRNYLSLAARQITFHFLIQSNPKSIQSKQSNVSTLFTKCTFLSEMNVFVHRNNFLCP